MINCTSEAVPASEKHSSKVSLQPQATVTVAGVGAGGGFVSPPPGTSLANTLIESKTLATNTSPFDITLIMMLSFLLSCI
jgi:hypothetical protein